MIKYGTVKSDISKTAEGRKEAVKAGEAAAKTAETEKLRKKEATRVLP